MKTDYRSANDSKYLIIHLFGGAVTIFFAAVAVYRFILCFIQSDFSFLPEWIGNMCLMILALYFFVAELLESYRMKGGTIRIRTPLGTRKEFDIHSQGFQSYAYYRDGSSEGIELKLEDKEKNQVISYFFFIPRKKEEKRFQQVFIDYLFPLQKENKLLIDECLYMKLKQSFSTEDFESHLSGIAVMPKEKKDIYLQAQKIRREKKRNSILLPVYLIGAVVIIIGIHYLIRYLIESGKMEGTIDDSLPIPLPWVIFIVILDMLAIFAVSFYYYRRFSKMSDEEIVNTRHGR